jgi:hypothetical protein
MVAIVTIVVALRLAPVGHLGDRDRRGYYWDGGRWREPRWWNDRYQYNNHRSLRPRSAKANKSA